MFVFFRVKLSVAMMFLAISVFPDPGHPWLEQSTVTTRSSWILTTDHIKVGVVTH